MAKVSRIMTDAEYEAFFHRPRGVPLNQPYNPNSQNLFDSGSASSSTQIGSTSNDLTSSLFGNNAGGSFLDIAKALAQQKADLAKAERGDISGYRTKEMAQQAGYRLGEIKEQGGIQKGLEELRQAGMTGRTEKEITGRQILQQMNQDFQQATLERNRAAALSAGRAGSMFY